MTAAAEREGGNAVLPRHCCSPDLDTDVLSSLPAPSSFGEAATHAVAEELSSPRARSRGLAAPLFCRGHNDAFWIEFWDEYAEHTGPRAATGRALWW